MEGRINCFVNPALATVNVCTCIVLPLIGIKTVLELHFFGEIQFETFLDMSVKMGLFHDISKVAVQEDSFQSFFYFYQVHFEK